MTARHRDGSVVARWHARHKIPATASANAIRPGQKFFELRPANRGDEETLAGAPNDPETGQTHHKHIRDAKTAAYDLSPSATRTIAHHRSAYAQTYLLRTPFRKHGRPREKCVKKCAVHNMLVAGTEAANELHASSGPSAALHRAPGPVAAPRAPGSSNRPGNFDCDAFEDCGITPFFNEPAALAARVGNPAPSGAAGAACGHRWIDPDPGGTLLGK